MRRDELQLAQTHVLLGAEHITRQKAIIGRLDDLGADTSLAERILVTFEETQAMHVEHLERIQSR